MRLLRVELNRFFSRRAVALLLLVALALTAVVAGTAIWTTRPVDAASRAVATAEVRDEAARPGLQRELATCREDPERYFGSGASAADCDEQLVPTVESRLARSELTLADRIDGDGTTVAVLVAVLLVVCGATFAGADWASGALGTTLLFEHRRWRLWSTKALAVTLACLAAATVLLVGYWAALGITTAVRGTAPDAAVWRDIGWAVARGVALGAAAGLGGYALTMLLRHTGAALALLFVYAAGGEALLANLPVDRAPRWSPATNVLAWLRDGLRVYDDGVPCRPDRALCERTFDVGLLHAAVYLGVLLLLVAVVSALVFRRRDVA